MSDLEGLNKGPQKVPDPLWAIEQFNETQHTEQPEERDGNSDIFCILRTSRIMREIFSSTYKY